MLSFLSRKSFLLQELSPCVFFSLRKFIVELGRTCSLLIFAGKVFSFKFTLSCLVLLKVHMFFSMLRYVNDQIPNIASWNIKFNSLCFSSNLEILILVCQLNWHYFFHHWVEPLCLCSAAFSIEQNCNLCCKNFCKKSEEASSIQ